jgi:hypothetical protein
MSSVHAQVTWKPILCEAAIEAVPTGTCESELLEFRASYNATRAVDACELARSVAAFANADGGTLLLGAEARDGKLVRLPGLKNAATLAKWIRETIYRRLSDPPRFEITMLKPSGTAVIAVNVWPATHLVGLRLDDDKWQFFVRRPKGRQPMSFREVSMRMGDTIRPVALQLRDIRAQEAHAILLDAWLTSVRVEPEHALRSDERWTIADLTDSYVKLVNEHWPDEPLYVPLAAVMAVTPTKSPGAFKCSIAARIKRCRTERGGTSTITHDVSVSDWHRSPPLGSAFG